MKIASAAIIGSNSFTGNSFIRYLLDETDCQVLAISRSPEYISTMNAYLYERDNRDRVEFHQLDINSEINKIVDLLNASRPELVVNFSAQGEVRNSWKWPEQWYQTNTMSVVKLTTALADKDYLKRYVAISTPEVYGSTSKNLKENHCYQPSTPYGASKLGGDLHLFALKKRYDFPVVFTRAANLYGRFQQLYRIIPRTIIYLKMKKKIQLHGRGRAIRSFIHANDVADGTFKAAIKGKNGEVYHLAPQSEEYSIHNLVQMICEKMNCHFNEAVELIDENFGQDEMYSLNSDKARTELNWQPKVNFEEGIQEVIDWIEKNWQIIEKQPLEYIHKQ